MGIYACVRHAVLLCCRSRADTPRLRLRVIAVVDRTMVPSAAAVQGTNARLGNSRCRRNPNLAPEMTMTEPRSVLALRTVGGVTEEEWHVARGGTASLLLAGPDAFVEAILVALRPHFREPIEVWSPGSGLVLSSGGTGTLILQTSPRCRATINTGCAIGWKSRLAERVW